MLNLLELRLVPSLLVCLMLPLTRSLWVCLSFRCFFAAFSLLLLMWRWDISNDDEHYFFGIFFLFFGMTKLLWFRKKCLKCCTSYYHEINFWKIKWFKVFRNPNFFLFSYREFYADLDVYFPSWVFFESWKFL